VTAARLQISGLGARNPLDSNNTEAGRQANRRVELDVIPLDNGQQSSQQGRQY
jgi:flagellar motor protein MotB